MSQGRPQKEYQKARGDPTRKKGDRRPPNKTQPNKEGPNKGNNPNKSETPEGEKRKEDWDPSYKKGSQRQKAQKNKVAPSDKEGLLED